MLEGNGGNPFPKVKHTLPIIYVLGKFVYSRIYVYSSFWIKKGTIQKLGSIPIHNVFQTHNIFMETFMAKKIPDIYDLISSVKSFREFKLITKNDKSFCVFYGTL